MTNIPFNFCKDDIEHLSKVGIYSIHHKDRPNKLYIGSTTTYKVSRFSHRGFYKRFYDHYRSLMLNKHHSKYLQNTVNKLGINGIVFSILEICEDHSVKEIRDKEQSWIDKLNPCYNTLDTVYAKGRVWTPEECERQSKKMQGHPLPATAYKTIQKKVYQYDKKNQFVAEYDSIETAAIATKTDRASISKCASGYRNTAGNFVWSFIKY